MNITTPNGNYPEKLEDLPSKGTLEFPNIQDPTSIERKDSAGGDFYYQLDSSGAFYYLRSVGPDGIPFTADDILPSPRVRVEEDGLRIER